MTSIDIHSGKLVEWVASRFKMEKNWSDKVSVIREKIEKALLDMPESEEIKVLLLGTYINYFHCRKILDVLKGTESNTKNIFGQYSSKRYKDWQEIVKLYEANNYFIIDSAQVLNQLVSFDIPSIKKSIEKNNKTLNDSTRKEKDYSSAINEANGNLKNLSKKYSVELDSSIDQVIDTESIRRQLRQSLCDLPSSLERIESNIESLRESRDLYDRFVHSRISIADEKCVPMLTYLLEMGNCTVYQWKYNKPPPLHQKSTDITNNVIEIDKPLSSIIDHQLETEENDEISWECIDSELNTICNGDVEEIDFGIELSEETGIDGVAGDAEKTHDLIDETQTILEHYDTRELLLDDLHELHAFFTCCIDETRLRTGSVLDSIENIEEKWPELNLENVEEMRNKVTQFMEQMTNKSLEHLIMMKTNASYLDSILKLFEHERSVIMKNRNLENLLRNRVTEAAHENVSLDHQLKTHKVQVGILKEQIENAISKAFNDRKVRIIGEISTI